MSRPLDKVRRVARELGARFEDDRQAGVFRVEAPAGFVWKGWGVHELVAPWVEMVAEWRAEAALDLLERMEGLEECDTTGCEWCADNGVTIL